MSENILMSFGIIDGKPYDAGAFCRIMHQRSIEEYDIPEQELYVFGSFLHSMDKGRFKYSKRQEKKAYRKKLLRETYSQMTKKALKSIGETRTKVIKRFKNTGDSYYLIQWLQTLEDIEKRSIESEEMRRKFQFREFYKNPLGKFFSKWDPFKHNVRYNDALDGLAALTAEMDMVA